MRLLVETIPGCQEFVKSFFPMPLIPNLNYSGAESSLTCTAPAVRSQVQVLGGSSPMFMPIGPG